ncbi:MAG: hypothetical protein SOZ80_01740 [Prevotella sp.]|uniref:hypothetical protein n=1 Tax=Prevotella sp. TaxID=59823 RepID=UPI002A291E0C|nr:hypothetical protein [Prevotella sp.]MDD7317391.1 hypothetical protein [Prevotellaceae bacterium]MDY4019489.1 hypothetical protein [Prevotella sp.]
MKRQKLTMGALKRLLVLYNGEEVTQSETQTRLFDRMKQEGVLLPATQHGTRITFKAASKELLEEFLSDKLNIQDLQNYLNFRLAEAGDVPQKEVAEPLTDSRNAKQGYMEGFYVTSMEPIEAQVGGSNFVINPPRGTYVYIYEYKIFSVPRDVLIVGVEEMLAFHYIHVFRKLFPKKKILFVHRHPHSSELGHWLKLVSNRYIHFADLDFVSIYNFQNEIFSCVGERASFFIPPNAKEMIERGSRKRYEAQVSFYRNMPVVDMRLNSLLELINTRHQCYFLSEDIY